MVDRNYEKIFLKYLHLVQFLTVLCLPFHGIVFAPTNTEIDQNSGPAAEDMVWEGDRPSEYILIFGRDRAPLDPR